MQESYRVGVFDSGIGGLSVLHACMETVPGAVYFYYGDNARAPYGSRPREEVAAFTHEALSCFRSLGVDAAILACNTATAACIEEMRVQFSFPILGVEPAVGPAARECRSVLILATPLTAGSPRLAALVAKFPGTRFTVFPAPDLAETIERHFLKGAPLTLSDHLPAASDCDGVVLGCTHYSLIRGEIAHFLGMKPFDGACGTAKHLKSVLMAGTSDHFKPPLFPNNCFTQKYNETTENNVIFLGSGGMLNKNLFVSKRLF